MGSSSNSFVYGADYSNSKDKAATMTFINMEYVRKIELENKQLKKENLKLNKKIKAISFFRKILNKANDQHE